jgi:hypothetical protein
MSQRAIAFLAWAAVLSGQTPKTGPEPGSPVPGFSLPDQDGQARTLPSLMGPKGLLLVFFRSADW